MDLYRFPFDIQSCNITLQSSAHSVKELKISTLIDVEWLTQESKETFQAQGEWELLSINVTKSNSTFIWSVKDQLIYQITIKRRPLLYLVNFMLPIFFFLVLDVISFFIDTSGSDKLSFKVTLLLSISVMLLILNETLPSTADKIPLIGVYCSVIFSLIGISILETILVNCMMARGAKRRSLETTAAVTGRNVTNHPHLILIGTLIKHTHSPTSLVSAKESVSCSLISPNEAPCSTVYPESPCCASTPEDLYSICSTLAPCMQGPMAPSSTNYSALAPSSAGFTLPLSFDGSSLAPPSFSSAVGSSSAGSSSTCSFWTFHRSTRSTLLLHLSAAYVHLWHQEPP